jgi:hypothetical protein
LPRRREHGREHPVIQTEQESSARATQEDPPSTLIQEPGGWGVQQWRRVKMRRPAAHEEGKACCTAGKTCGRKAQGSEGFRLVSVTAIKWQSRSHAEDIAVLRVSGPPQAEQTHAACPWDQSDQVGGVPSTTHPQDSRPQQRALAQQKGSDARGGRGSREGKQGKHLGRVSQ